MSIIVSAFPGMGKIYLKNSSKLKIVDLNSSDYKFVNKIINSSKVRELNPDYPNNFIDRIKELMNSKENAPDIIFVSTHSEIRSSLNSNGINYFIIYPYIKDKDKFISQYRERGNSDKFCLNMEANWDRYIDGIINETFPVHIKSNNITEELLKSLIDYNKIIESSRIAAKSRGLSIINPYSVNWSIISRERRNWIDSDFAYKDYIDWDMLCKFGKLPDSIINNKQFHKFITWKYLDKNKSKYGLKTRKLISKNV